MCNDFGNKIPYSDYLAALSRNRIPVKWPNAAPNLESRDDIWPTDRAPVIRRLEDGKNEFFGIAVGLSASAAQESARHKFPFRRSTIPGRPLSGTGIAFF